MIRVAVSGASGRMGATVCDAVGGADGMELSGRADPELGTSLEDLLSDAEVVVDFTTPDAAPGNIAACLGAGVHCVVGTTGFDLDALREAAQSSGREANCFVAPNFAIGAVLMMESAKLVAAHMPECEIVELHHDRKLDAPSGTAARTADLIREAGGNVHEPIHSVRLPGLVAHQEVIFGGEGQTLTIRHDSIDRHSFMPGVLLAVRKVGDLDEPFTVGLENLLLSTPVRDELATLDATAQAELVRSGEATPLELVDAAIARIEAIDSELNSVNHRFFDEAREEASGQLPDGPFKGVPFLLKDLGISFVGQPLHMGMRLLKEIDFRAPADSHLALRFREAGLVTVGKTNTPEIGILPTTEPVSYGPTRNPWDTSRSAGGSSGGSGAAVAAGLVPFAHASDGGGSIRIPASHNGLVGLKTTRARTSAGPLAGDFASGLSENFALTRSVRDAAVLLDAVHGPSAGDPYAAPAPERPYAEELETPPGKLRIAMITRSAVETQPSADALDALRSAAELLGELGHEVEELDIVGEGLGDEMPGAFIKRWAGGMAQTVRLFGRVIDRPVTEDDVEPLTWALKESGEQVSAPDYLEAIGLHQLVGRAIGGIYEGGVDLLMTPTVGEKPPPLGEFDDTGPDPFRALKRAEVPAMFTSIFNATGQPAISLPLHWTEDNLPLGVQFAASLGHEGILLRIAAQLEEARPWAERLASIGSSR